jgi:dipeptidyl-peptidase-4
MKKAKTFLFRSEKTFTLLLFICFFSFNFSGIAQINWAKNGDSYYKLERNQLLTYTLPNQDAKIVISKEQLTPAGK